MRVVSRKEIRIKQDAFYRERLFAFVKCVCSICSLLYIFTFILEVLKLKKKNCFLVVWVEMSLRQNIISLVEEGIIFLPYIRQRLFFKNLCHKISVQLSGALTCHLLHEPFSDATSLKLALTNSFSVCV